MNQNNRPDPTSLQRRGDELRSQLAHADAHDLAWKTGSVFKADHQEKGIFSLLVWNKETLLTYPGFIAKDRDTGKVVSPLIETLLLYYYSTASGAPIQGEWVSFADLPDGRFYNQAFQGYTGSELGRFFQSDAARLKQAVTSSGGVLVPDAPGDLAYRFMALPRVPLLLVYWQGDEDFPSSYQVLFDAAADRYLPTDACAILGSYLTGQIKKHA